jgi:hypothetical protein
MSPRYWYRWLQSGSLVMAGAAAVHARRKEAPMVAMNAVLLVLAVFVAWGRFGPYSFTP